MEYRPKRFYSAEVERNDLFANIYRFFMWKPLMKTVWTEADVVTYEAATHEEVIIQGKEKPYIINYIPKDERDI